MINKDAFSNGQIDSKLWLCETLESLKWSSKLTQIYAGWYGLTAFLLLTRNQFKVDRIESYDVDPTCETIADMINENWVIKNWQFKAFTQDCNQTLPGLPDLVINTSTEHFTSKQWFDNIRSGTRVILQGNNMPHDDHHISSESLLKFKKEYPLSSFVFEGEKLFSYPTWSFTRYMIIGIK